MSSATECKLVQTKEEIKDFIETHSLDDAANLFFIWGRCWQIKCKVSCALAFLLGTLVSFILEKVLR